MKELEFLKIIQKTLSKNAHIGDDCAYLKDLGIVITQDSMVEDIHFSRNFSTPKQIAYKAVIINISDIFASGAIPKYITVSLSMPKDIDETFVSEFYNEIEKLSKQYDFEVIGGDITGGSKCFISICAIGLTKGRKISSRSNAQVGDYIVTTGNHGSSVAGLWLLQNELPTNHPQLTSLKNNHLEPSIKNNFSNEVATKCDKDYAMMDTSDGLADALFKIAQASNVLLSVDFDNVPYDKKIEEVAKLAKVDFMDWILYGGEDFQLVACINEKNLNKIDKSTYTIIGRVKEKTQEHFVEIFSDNKTEKMTNLEKTFNHFKN